MAYVVINNPLIYKVFEALRGILFMMLVLRKFPLVAVVALSFFMPHMTAFAQLSASSITRNLSLGSFGADVYTQAGGAR